MSICLLQSIFIAGVLSPVDGSTLSLSAALEADLVNQGKAVWVAAPELTASELAHASAHARMRQPNGVPIILAQSAIPMILPSSGTMGANGALTGLAALPYSVFPQPCFMYFPAGKVFSGSPAGMYYASITAATTATVYDNMYTSGLPQDAIPAVPTPVVDAGPGAYTQTTGADITLTTIYLPGGLVGRYGSVECRVGILCRNNANAKPIQYKLDDTHFCGATLNAASNAGINVVRGFANRGTGKQVAMVSSSVNSFGSVGQSVLAVDTTVDQPIAFTAQLAVATDWVAFEQSIVTVYPG